MILSFCKPTLNLLITSNDSMLLACWCLSKLFVIWLVRLHTNEVRKVQKINCFRAHVIDQPFISFKTLPLWYVVFRAVYCQYR